MTLSALPCLHHASLRRWFVQQGAVQRSQRALQQKTANKPRRKDSSVISSVVNVVNSQTNKHVNSQTNKQVDEARSRDEISSETKERALWATALLATRRSHHGRQHLSRDITTPSRPHESRGAGDSSPFALLPKHDRRRMQSVSLPLPLVCCCLCVCVCVCVCVCLFCKSIASSQRTHVAALFIC